MSLTINEILEDIPLFSEAVCVAGMNGLNNQVKWTNIINDLEIIPWVREGDLILTNGQGIDEDETAQKKYINEIIQAGIAGVVFSTGRYIEKIPECMVNIAEENDLPLITIPYTAHFAEITQDIHERILREKNKLTEKVFKIHDILTNLVVEGCSLEKFATTMANILNRSITIEDLDLKILAYSLIGPTDEVRSRSIQEGYTPPEVVSYLRKLGVFERVQKDPKPQYLKPIPAMGIKYERIVAPILIGEQLFGYIWIIANDESLTQLDYMAIERGAIVAALVLSRDLAVYEAEQRGKSKIIDHLIDPDANELSFQAEEITERLGMSGDYQIINILNIQEEFTPIRSLSQFLAEKIKKSKFQATIIERTKSLIIIVNALKPENTEKFVEFLLSFARQNDQNWVVGISQIANSIDNFKKAFNEGVDASRIGMILGKGEPSFWYYKKLGFLTWLIDTPLEIIHVNHYYRIVESMSQYDYERGSEILKTLEIYFSTFANAQETAKLLFIHRNTLRQRLKKVHEIWDIQFDDSLEMLNLFYAIKAFQIKNRRKRMISN
jgi:PucR family transcriptional regulator, purine catabolism regulatory protein